MRPLINFAFLLQLYTSGTCCVAALHAWILDFQYQAPPSSSPKTNVEIANAMRMSEELLWLFVTPTFPINSKSSMQYLTWHQQNSNFDKRTNKCKISQGSKGYLPSDSHIQMLGIWWESPGLFISVSDHVRPCRLKIVHGHVNWSQSCQRWDSCLLLDQETLRRAIGA